jgi:hypothetical protein
LHPQYVIKNGIKIKLARLEIKTALKRADNLMPELKLPIKGCVMIETAPRNEKARSSL